MTSLRFRAETDITKVTLGGVPDRPGIAAELFGRLGSEGFSI